MHVGLIDIDSHNFPNLCLMKLSTFFKKQGYTTSLLKPADVLKGQLLFNTPDLLYGAVVFEENKRTAEQLEKIGAIIGGTGILMETKLAPEIESIYPDYDLYGIRDTAYGFLTRGCPRNCSFCIVGQKEGLKSIKVANLSQFWNGQKYIKLLDPNLLACRDHEDLLQQLIESQAWVDFTQGVDSRLLNRENVKLLSKIKTNLIHFAWDNAKDDVVPYMLWHFKKATNLTSRERRVYVLTNYDSTFEEDLYRVYKLREMDYTPYIMIYKKETAPRNVRMLQRWVNNLRIWRTIDKFEDYNPKVG